MWKPAFLFFLLVNQRNDDLASASSANPDLTLCCLIDWSFTLLINHFCCKFCLPDQPSYYIFSPIIETIAIVELETATVYDFVYSPI